MARLAGRLWAPTAIGWSHRAGGLATHRAVHLSLSLPAAIVAAGQAAPERELRRALQTGRPSRLADQRNRGPAKL